MTPKWLTLPLLALAAQPTLAQQDKPETSNQQAVIEAKQQADLHDTRANGRETAMVAAQLRNDIANQTARPMNEEQTRAILGAALTLQRTGTEAPVAYGSAIAARMTKIAEGIRAYLCQHGDCDEHHHPASSSKQQSSNATATSGT